MKAKMFRAAMSAVVLVGLSLAGVVDNCTHAANLLTNGSFESGSVGWTFQGNVQVTDYALGLASDGTHWCCFNTGDTTPNGVISQSFTTVPATKYLLFFDFGSWGGASGHLGPQGVRVSVSNSSLVTQDIMDYTPYNINYTPNLYSSYSMMFTANSTSATLSFRDLAGDTIACDGHLDNVVVQTLAAITLANVSNASIITGGTGSLGFNVTNSGGANLNYTVAGAVQSGSATLGTVSPSSGTLTAGLSQSSTVSATSTNLGTNTILFTATDPNASNSPQTAIATLNVLDHSNASLSATVNQTTQTVDFGKVLKGGTVADQNFTIYNRAANTTAANTANLKLTGSTATGDSAISTNLSAFNGLAAGNGNTYTTSLNTSNYMTGSKTFTMSASQLVDDSTLSGSGSNNNGAMTVTVQANVGMAGAGNGLGRSDTNFGAALTGTVNAGGNYGGLASKTTVGAGVLGTEGKILDGVASTDHTVSMKWRQRFDDVQINESNLLYSDVVQVSGMDLDPTNSIPADHHLGLDETDPYVLQMSFQPTQPLGQEPYWLASLQTDANGNQQWATAVDGNFNLDPLATGFHPNQTWSSLMHLGDYGFYYDGGDGNYYAWAVVDHNGQYAVVPLPSAVWAGMVLLVGLGLTRCFRRDRGMA